MRERVCVAAAWILTAAALGAQGISPDEIRVSSKAYAPRSSFRIQTNLVDLVVVVRDSHGQPVAGLTKENFRIQDNGKDREVAQFSVETSGGDVSPSAGPPAHFIALFLDDVNTQDEQHANDLKQTREAAARYVRDALQPGVRIALFTASGAPSLDFTAEAGPFTAAIAGVAPHPQLSERACVTPYLAFQIAVAHDEQALSEAQYQSRNSACAPKVSGRDDALAEAREIWQRTEDVTAATFDAMGRAADRLSTMPGARVLVVASSGFLVSAADRAEDQLIDRALRDGVVIQSLDSKGIYGESTAFGTHATDARDIQLTGSPGGIRAGINSQQFNVARVGMRAETLNVGLQSLAEQTGGRFFHNSNELHAGFVELANPPEVRYRLALRPGDIAADGSYHKLKISLVSRHGDSIQARKGYFAPDADSSESKVDAEVRSDESIADFPVNVSGETAKLKNGDTDLSVLATVDVSKLDFAREGKRRKQKIRFVSALLDQQGSIVAAKEATMDLSLKDATYNRLLKTGLNAKLTLQASPGAYRLREVVQESGHKLSCSTHDLQLP